MFVSQAHSFGRQARLAVTLAWVAGYTNIVSVLTCGTVTSHVSGTSSNLGRDLAAGSWGLASFALFLLAAFCGGAMISGFCSEWGRRRHWQSIYVLPIIVETSLLALFALSIEWHNSLATETGFTLYLMTGLASMAMGLQNATITQISGGGVRTTHVTGVLTDLGMEFVHGVWCLVDLQAHAHSSNKEMAGNAPPAGQPLRITARRLGLLGAVFVVFIIGASLGTLVYEYAPRWVMFPPVAFLVWLVYLDLSRPVAEIQPSQLIQAEEGLNLPTSLAVFHLRSGRHHQGKTQRMPNLLAWSETLPANTRVAILDLGEIKQLEVNAALELRALVARFEAQHRKLVIAGVTPQLYKQLSIAGTGAYLDLDDVCHDLELAIARGLSFLE